MISCKYSYFCYMLTYLLELCVHLLGEKEDLNAARPSFTTGVV